jgi:CTP synthase (UTP-ammonia lyase)
MTAIGYFHRTEHKPPYRQERLYDTVHIVLVGKYTSLKDSYMSVVKSLEHSAFRCNRKLVLDVRAVRL